MRTNLPSILSTKDCIVDTMKAMGTLRIDQLIKFFRSADDARNLDYYIKELISSGILDYDKGTNEVTYHNSLLLSRDPVIRRIIAFWVPAYMGFDNIREMHPLRYPSQILFGTETNETFDLSVCVTAEEGAFCRYNWDLAGIAGENDNTNHIAVVSSHEVGREILQYGFDSYCIYDDDKTPQYYTS